MKTEEKTRRLQQERKRKAVKQYINQLNEKDKSNLLKKFEKHIKEQDAFYLYKKYKEQGMQSRIVQAVFNVFVSQLINQLSK